MRHLDMKANQLLNKIKNVNFKSVIYGQGDKIISGLQNASWDSKAWIDVKNRYVSQCAALKNGILIYEVKNKKRRIENVVTDKNGISRTTPVAALTQRRSDSRDTLLSLIKCLGLGSAQHITNFEKLKEHATTLKQEVSSLVNVIDETVKCSFKCSFHYLYHKPVLLQKNVIARFKMFQSELSDISKQFEESIKPVDTSASSTSGTQTSQ